MEIAFSLKPRIEAVLVAAGRPIKIAKLAEVFGARIEEVEDAIRLLEDDLLSWERGFHIEHRKGETIRIVVKTPYTNDIGKIFPERALKPLTSQAIETLVVIAKKQPITTSDVARARGVTDSSGTVESMARRGLIAYQRIGGVRHWHVTQAFLDRFNLSSREELLHDEEVYRKTFPSLAEAGDSDPVK